MTPEAKLSEKVRQGLREWCDIERIENRVNLGIPDMLIGVGNRFVMLELKVATGRKVELRPHQVAFHMRHGRLGRPGFILVWKLATKSFPDTLLLYESISAMQLHGVGIDLPPFKKWELKSMLWREFYEALAS